MFSFRVWISWSRSAMCFFLRLTSSCRSEMRLSSSRSWKTRAFKVNQGHDKSQIVLTWECHDVLCYVRVWIVWRPHLWWRLFQKHLNSDTHGVPTDAIFTLHLRLCGDLILMAPLSVSPSLSNTWIVLLWINKKVGAASRSTALHGGFSSTVSSLEGRQKLMGLEFWSYRKTTFVSFKYLVTFFFLNGKKI